jgi:hypothetical protein
MGRQPNSLAMVAGLDYSSPGKGKIMEALEFTLELNRIPVKLQTANGGPVIDAHLRELSGVQRDKYLDGMKAKMNVKAGKMESIKTFEGLQSQLLSLCLYKDESQKFTEKEIQEFPAKVQTALFEAAQKISGLDIEEKEEGND